VPALLRRVVLALLLVASAFGVVACSSDDYGPIAPMQAMPESHLAPFPGATLIGSGPLPRGVGFMEATTAAGLEREFGVSTNGSPIESSIIDYYDSLLKPLGWSGGPAAWHKAGYRFTVVFNNPLAAGTREQAYELTYWEALTEDLSVTSPPATRTP
jgi:hypothetical protein